MAITPTSELATKLKVRLNPPPEQDALINILIEAAISAVLAYTGRTAGSWLPAFDETVVAYAAATYNRMGADGIAAQSAGKLSTTFETEAEARILGWLSRYRLAGVGL